MADSTDQQACVDDPPSSFLADISGGQEPVHIPFEAGTTSHFESLFGDRFKEYRAQRTFHTSYIDELVHNLRTADGALPELDPDADELDPGLYGCECEADTAACASSSSTCDCVAEHGNFYHPDTAVHGPSAKRLDLDVIPPLHVLYECSEVCACQAGRDLYAPDDRRACGLSDVRGGVRVSLLIKPIPPSSPPHTDSAPPASSGLGVFAAAPIPRGTFVCNYEGELVSRAEAARRWLHQAAAAQGNYILTVRERARAGSAAESRLDIDPTARGNVARFINHLCPPLTNLVILPVRCAGPLVLLRSTDGSSNDDDDDGIPASAFTLRRLVDWHRERQKSDTPARDSGTPIALFSSPPQAALFASRDVERGEQLGFDYSDAGQSHGNSESGAANKDDDDDNNKVASAAAPAVVTRPAKRRRTVDSDEGTVRQSADSSSGDRTRCLCGSPACRGWLPLDPAL